PTGRVRRRPAGRRASPRMIVRSRASRLETPERRLHDLASEAIVRLGDRALAQEPLQERTREARAEDQLRGVLRRHPVRDTAEPLLPAEVLGEPADELHRAGVPLVEELPMLPQELVIGESSARQ